MAGRAPRESRGHGRSSRLVSSWPDDDPGSAAASGLTAPPAPPRSETSSPTTSIATRSVYRTFIQKGMAPDEAANLTAFVSGIPVTDLHWSLRQVNQLLFLREMANTRRFGKKDGGVRRPH